jgi:uncharacterized protein (TIGR03118 family)
MNQATLSRRHKALHTLNVVAAAAALLAACGGGGGDDGDTTAARPVLTGTPLQQDPDDQADASTLAQIDTLVTDTSHALARAGLPQADSAEVGSPTGTATPLAAEAAATAADRVSRGWKGWYPGLVQTNLVANKPGFGAAIIEPLMQNPWGIAIRPAGFGGHFWLGAAGTAKSIQYVGDVGGTPLFQDALDLVDTGGPTSGVAFNPGSQFVITQNHANGPITAATKFFFANLGGSITAWTERPLSGGGFDHPTDSVTVVDRTATGSSFIGVTVVADGQKMLAADFGADAQLRSYNGQFEEQAPLANIFRPGGQKVPGGFEAFNVQALGDRVFATYGRQVPPDPNQAPPAQGRLVEFDSSGKVVAHWRGRGYLNYPWGVAQAPKDFGLYGGCLLVGNFGDGTVVAFHPKLKVALDYVRDRDGKRIVIDGLWGLQFGNGASLGEANHMYFAAGPNKEVDGLFGKLQASAAPLPFLAGLSLCR